MFSGFTRQLIIHVKSVRPPQPSPGTYSSPRLRKGQQLLRLQQEVFWVVLFLGNDRKTPPTLTFQCEKKSNAFICQNIHSGKLWVINSILKLKRKIIALVPAFTLMLKTISKGLSSSLENLSIIILFCRRRCSNGIEN